LAPFAARSDTFITLAIQEALTVPTPLTSPFARSMDIPRRMYARAVFPRAGFLERARHRRTDLGIGNGRLHERLPASSCVRAKLAAVGSFRTAIELSENSRISARCKCNGSA